MVQIGMKAPKFKLLNQNNQEVSLNDFLGKNLVVYFYPKDNTPGCTRQACAFRDLYLKFQAKDIIVIGISKDSVNSHKKFMDSYNLPFILLSDPSLETIKAYDVWQEKNMYGKLTMGVARSTFLINAQGEIVKIYKKASPDTNAQEILEYYENM